MHSEPSKALFDEFYIQVGMAITGWANLDNELFTTCARIIGCSPRRAAVIYYRTPTIDSRLTLADDLIATVYPTTKSGKHPHPGHKKWTLLSREIRDALKVRNRMAHSPIARFLQDEPLPNGFPVGLSLFFDTAQGETLRGKPKQWLRVGEIKTHIQFVTQAKADLRDYRTNELEARLSEQLPPS